MKKSFIKVISLVFVILLLICSPLPAEKSAQKANLKGLKESPQNPNWAKYHSTNEAYALLESWAALFPNLTNLYTIGHTLKGTPLEVLEITNKQTGSASEKPAYYYDGNIHSGELTGAEVVLHFAWYLLFNYGKDPYVTQLVDTRTFYIRPKFNPDGADIALNTPFNLRSTPRPYDEDGDGLLDEDPPNDLNEDGSITLMRVKNPHGLWKISSQDSRIMARRDIGDQHGDFYDLYSEGIDDDGDGYFNEDGIGGIDMNRNFSRNWGMEFEQGGAGPYPLSEPETRVTIEFFHSHRNITGVFHGHTSGGFLYRLPSTTSWDTFPLSDQRLILELSDKYHSTTGQPVRPSYHDPRQHRHGTLVSWAYWDFGVIGFVPEFWGGFGRDYNNDGLITEAERLLWNQKELGGEGFVNWTPYNHPQLGAVEIGGWKTKFVRQNPPPKFLKNEIEKYVNWMLWLAEISPYVVIKDISASEVNSDGLIKVRVEIANVGYLSTNLTQRAIDAKIAVPVRVTVDLQNAELISGEKLADLGHLKGLGDTLERVGNIGSRRLLEYIIRLTGPKPLFMITVRSEKGGTTRREITLSR